MELGRFAPTPSGRMHLGNVFSALLAWLSAKSMGGEVLLRIEDLDTVRCTAQHTALLRDDLNWLGLRWDCEQPCQSSQSARYAAILEDLRQCALAYPCWCSRADIEHAANAPHASDGHTIYPGTCRTLSAAERAERMAKKAPLWRLRVPDETISFTDGHFGPYSENLAAACGDFILRRADGIFAYQLAVVADDIAAGVTQVVRGRDLLSSTPRQLFLYRLLGAEPPKYYHIPLLTAADGRRLSKRDRDLDLGLLRQRFTAEQLIGKLAHAAELTDSEEPCTAEDLIPLFSWNKIPQEDIAISLQ